MIIYSKNISFDVNPDHVFMLQVHSMKGYTCKVICMHTPTTDSPYTEERIIEPPVTREKLKLYLMEMEANAKIWLLNYIQPIDNVCKEMGMQITYH